jgi:hypothetical protein
VKHVGLQRNRLRSTEPENYLLRKILVEMGVTIAGCSTVNTYETVIATSWRCLPLIDNKQALGLKPNLWT